jgi:signal transduction histidine kinase
VWSQAFQEWDFQTISAISHQLSISIDNIELIATIRSQTEQLRNLSAKLVQVQEQDLKNISRELHDEVGQALTAVAINLGTIKSNKSQILNEETVERLEESLLMTENVLEQVREISHNLHPSILEDLGLVSALRWFVGRYRDRTGIAIGLKGIAVDGNLNPEIALACYRVVQEALTNVVKHAQATRVQICLKEEGHTLSCIIEDNGNGYDQEAEAVGDYHVRGIGLISMRERISSIGGHLSVQSRPGQGTTISFQIPLKEEIA